jgi:hypothetical protein
MCCFTKKHSRFHIMNDDNSKLFSPRARKRRCVTRGYQLLISGTPGDPPLLSLAQPAPVHNKVVIQDRVIPLRHLYIIQESRNSGSSDDDDDESILSFMRTLNSSISLPHTTHEIYSLTGQIQKKRL